MSAAPPPSKARRRARLGLALLLGPLLAACDRAPPAPAPLVPGLAGALPTLAEVRIEQGGTTLVFERAGEEWRIRDASWRADRRWLQPLLLSLANARCDEPRTADPGRFGRIGVAWPPEDAAAASDAAGATDGASSPGPAFARPTGRVVVTIDGRETAVIVGHPQARGGTFVRVEQAAHSCLTAATLRLPARVSEWFDPQLWRVPIESVTAVRIDEPGMLPLRLGRRDGRFMPDGAFAALTPLPDALAAALASPRQLDRRAVDPAGDAWSETPRVLHLDGEGGTRTLALRRDGAQTWARVLAAPESERPMFGTREFLLPPDVAEPLWTARDALGAN